MVQRGMGEACGLQDAHHLSGCPFGGLGGQGKAGRRHFALIFFAPHLQFRNGFLTGPVFANTIILASLETTRLVELRRVPSLVKAQLSVATREPSTMAPKERCGRVLAPFNVPMAMGPLAAAVVSRGHRWTATAHRAAEYRPRAGAIQRDGWIYCAPGLWGLVGGVDVWVVPRGSTGRGRGLPLAAVLSWLLAMPCGRRDEGQKRTTDGS